jgi:hypothetical protein
MGSGVKLGVRSEEGVAKAIFNHMRRGLRRTGDKRPEAADGREMGSNWRCRGCDVCRPTVGLHTSHSRNLSRGRAVL